MDKINFVNGETRLNKQTMDTLQDNVEDAIDNINSGLQVIPTFALPVTSTTEEQALLNTTISEAGTYLFVVNVPMNYYGESGRELFLYLKINNKLVATHQAVISDAYTITQNITEIKNIPANSAINITVRNTVAGKNFAAGNGQLQYIKLK